MIALACIVCLLINACLNNNTNSYCRINVQALKTSKELGLYAKSILGCAQYTQLPIKLCQQVKK